MVLIIGHRVGEFNAFVFSCSEVRTIQSLILQCKYLLYNLFYTIRHFESFETDWRGISNQITSLFYLDK